MPTLYWCPHQVLKATGAPCNTLLSFLRNRRYSEKATKINVKTEGDISLLLLDFSKNFKFTLFNIFPFV